MIIIELIKCNGLQLVTNNTRAIPMVNPFKIIKYKILFILSWLNGLIFILAIWLPLYNLNFVAFFCCLDLCSEGGVFSRSHYSLT